MRHRFQSVIFDFDYTLADSSRGAIECINFALSEMGLAHVSAEAACRTIGLSLHETFLTLGEHHEPHRCDEFYRLFVQRSAARWLTEWLIDAAEEFAVPQ